MRSEREVAQSCPTLSDPMNCSPPGSSIHGIFQARVLEWGVIAFPEEKPRVTEKFGLIVQNESGQRQKNFCQENALVIANTLFQQHKRHFTHGHHQMVNTEDRLIIFFAAEDGEGFVSKNKTES